MILLPVDEAYALDYLAVLYAKRDNGLKVDPEIKRIEQFLAVQFSNFQQVLASKEFHVLYQANLNTFDAIELAHKDKISARKVQETNYFRFIAKSHLQERFWPKVPLIEQKTALDKAALTLKP